MKELKKLIIQLSQFKSIDKFEFVSNLLLISDSINEVKQEISFTDIYQYNELTFSMVLIDGLPFKSNDIKELLLTHLSKINAYCKVKKTFYNTYSIYLVERERV